MPERPLRTVLDLTMLSDEDRAKLETNVKKSVKSGRGFASTLQIRDSNESRTPDTTVTEAHSEGDSEVLTEEQPARSEAEVSASESPQEQSTFDPSILQSLIEQAVTKNIAPLQSQAAASQARVVELEEQLAARDAQIEESRSAQSAVDSLAQLLGRSATPAPSTTIVMPSVNTKTTTDSDRLTGVLAEYAQERSASGVQVRTTRKGALVPVYDVTKVDRFAVEHGWNKKFSPGWKTLMDEITEHGKKNGLFRGSSAMSEAQARSATSATDVLGGFLETLSSIMRVSARPGLIFHQFANTVHRFDRGLGERVDIPRARYPDILTDSRQRLLSGSNTYVPIDSSNTPIQTGFTPLQLQEYGRGGPEASPMAIPTFVEAYSMIGLMPILEANLFFDYYNFEDLIIREQWKPTTGVFYFNGTDGDLVTDASSVATGGTCTRKALRKLFTRLFESQVVPLQDGCYGLVLVPRQIEQLKESLAEEWEPPTLEQVAELTNMMAAQYPNGENLQIQGYMGKYEQFHIWTTNSFGVVNTGLTTDYDQPGKEGVAQETNGASGSSTFRQGYAFGGSTIGRGIGGAGVQILYDERTDFGRMERAIWHCYEAHGPLDVDPTGYNDTSPVPQELRVYKIRTVDVAVA